MRTTRRARGRRRLPRLRHGLHGRGRGRAARRRPTARERVWDALTGDGATPVGLGARDTLRLEVCFHLYGNDLSRGPQPDRGRPRLGAASSTPASSAPTRSRRRATRATSSCRSPSPAPGIPRQGNPIDTRARPRRRDERDAVALPRDRHRHGATCPRRPPSPARRSRWTCAARSGRPRCASGPSTRKGGLSGGGELSRGAAATTPSTTGRGSTATRPPSASPGSPRTSSARSCSSTRPRSAPR